MKKFYSISLLFLLCFMLQAKAQTANSGLRFVDANGKMIKDNTTITSDKVVKDNFKEDNKNITDFLFIENVDKNDYTFYLQYTINSFKGDYLAVCFGGECTQADAVGSNKIENLEFLKNNNTNKKIDLEFTLEDKGNANITLQLFYKSKESDANTPFTAGPKVTYNFTSETTGINTTKATNIAYYNVFNLQGIQVLNKATSLSGLQAGTYIVQAYDNKGLVSTTKQIIH